MLRKIYNSFTYRFKKFIPNIIYLNLFSTWKLLDINSFEIRNKSTNKMLFDALFSKGLKPNGFLLLFYTDDYPTISNFLVSILNLMSIRVFAYSSSSNHNNIELIPDFLFDKWPAAKIES